VQSGIEASQTISPGIKLLFCLRVIQPSLMAFRRNKFRDLPSPFVVAQQDPLLDKYVEYVDGHEASWIHRSRALFDVCRLLTVQGVCLADVTPGALLHYAHDTRRVLKRAARRQEGRRPVLGRRRLERAAHGGSLRGQHAGHHAGRDAARTTQHR
jgi:hypothetical protein